MKAITVKKAVQSFATLDTDSYYEEGLAFMQ
jgi:hypothetical protein